ncbi:HNH endonuclease [Jatrophihabitans sp. GAS493]|uniref:HNH endonuclease n=1 Tax=Jatrophihabitans sp. GAS493 TaxID=1907575 RepID=UPI000BC01E4F|nr:HNH endonuclease signature motif containing protein [Jatrophihabitans sp. GAS493]SOD74636.1 HNH endonuclease [Jatrophihabitans sp. GAS493]
MFSRHQVPSRAAMLVAIKDALAEAPEADSAAELIDQIRLLEEIKAVAAAAQARATAKFVVSQRAGHVAAGVAAGVAGQRAGRGVAAQVALARRISPHQATCYISQAVTLTTELPATFERLAAGAVPEWRVLQIVGQTSWLSPEHRAAVDAEVAPQLEPLGHRQALDLVKKIAYRLDPHGYVGRLAQAEQDRRVSIRPAPDCMVRVSALLPVSQGVASYAALHSHASTVVGVGSEDRSRGQVMADTFVERLTGQARAVDVPVAVNLIITDQALFTSGTGTDEPAHLIGAGTIPAGLARRMVTDPSGETAMFLRRLYTHPDTHQLAAMETQSRLFTANQRHFLLLRDQTCRTPWCDAPIRHADHIQPAADGGPTSVTNGQGLCEACNHAKQAPDWTQNLNPECPGEVITTTPTGHRYPSRPPDPPGQPNPEHQSTQHNRAAA